MKRTPLGIALGLATALVVTGCATAPAPVPGPTGGPATTPGTTPSAAPTAAPTTLRGPETMILPGDKGTAFAEIRLPREDEAPVPDEISAFEPGAFPLSCLDGTGIQPPSLARLTDARVRQRSIPEGTDVDGLVMFTDEAAAHAFMVELRAAYQACAPIGPESDNRGTADDPIFERSLMATDTQTAPGVEAFSLRTWTERKVDGAWVEAPGGDVTLFARDGRYVALASSGGEYVGDSVEELEPGAILHGTAQDLLAVP